MPFQQIFTKAHPLAIDLLEKLLRFDPSQRLSCDEALKHPYFGSGAAQSPQQQQQQQQTASPQQQQQAYLLQQQQLAQQQAMAQQQQQQQQGLQR